MDRSSLLNSLSSLSSSASHTNFKPQFNLNSQPLSFNYSSSSAFIPQFLYKSNNSLPKNSTATVSPRPSLRSSAFALEEALVKTNDSSSKIYAREMLPKIDKSGRFCSPRAARELALSIIYAACLEGSDPVRLLEKRMNVRRELGYDFDKEKLLEYNHMSFGGPPVTVESIEEANELMQKNEMESAIEAEVLAAPLKLVYSKLILRFARKLLVAVMDKWDSHVLAINKVIPENWKLSPRVLSSVLHRRISRRVFSSTKSRDRVGEVARHTAPGDREVAALFFFSTTPLPFTHLRSRRVFSSTKSSLQTLD
ncbi:hypothetical protein QN277_011120 [Acacia crassicarpa]|uniref:NusB/RsmB/TIM44 domain-containing protein n=1 Tax=Acacia crassicarpa TaxID=499986 RepID=A0AAE1MXY1_9FABA|nr:hypothetical protein QN277_011120 [Acacia crassicarpa]